MDKKKRKQVLGLSAGVAALSLTALFAVEAYKLKIGLEDLEQSLDDLHCSTLELNQTIAKYYPDFAAENGLELPTAKDIEACPNLQAGSPQP